MSDYKYIDLTKNGYIRINLTKAEHLKIFPKLEYSIISKYEYYESENCIICRVFVTDFIKIISIILYPLLLLINGLRKFEELNKDISDLFHEKENGRFFSERVFKANLIKNGIEYKSRLEGDVK